MYINIATEDALGQAIATKMVATLTPFEINLRLGQKGFGHLKVNLKKYIEIARHTPLFLLTDLDQILCAPALIVDWAATTNVAFPSSFLFRVAVRETESWIMADTNGCEDFFGFRNVPSEPDVLPDPKRTLLGLAARAKREIREDLVGKKGAISSQGPGYNARLTQFVSEVWNPTLAAGNSPSLLKACNKLRSL